MMTAPATLLVTHGALLPGVPQEHAVLVRHLARLQQRISALLAEREAQVRGLAGEVLRLRAHAIAVCTAQAWGLPCPPTPGSAGAHHPSRVVRDRAPARAS